MSILTRKQALQRDLYTPTKKSYNRAPHHYRPPLDHFKRISQRLREQGDQKNSFKCRPESPTNQNQNQSWNQRVRRRQTKATRQRIYEQKGREFYGITNPHKQLR